MNGNKGDFYTYEKKTISSPKNTKTPARATSQVFFCGGDGGIRTHAPVDRPAAFRVRSLEPLGYISPISTFGALLKGTFD